MRLDSNTAYLPDFLDEFCAALSPDAVRALRAKSTYTSYQSNPVGFCEQVLKEQLTPDVQKMLRSVRDNPVTVAISANATGKSHGAARTAIWFYLSHQNCKVFTAAAPPLDNLRNILWGEIGSVTQEHPDLFTGHVITSLDVRRGPNDFLTGVTIPSQGTPQEREAKFSGKHQEHILFVLDEGDAIPDEVYSGIESCMSGGHFRLLVLFNPRQASGPVYRMIRDKTANVVYLSAFNHPNVITGRSEIPGAVDRDTTVRRINEWTRPVREGDKTDKNSVFTVPAFLVKTAAKRKGGGRYPPLAPGKRIIVNPAFSYMVLGRYPAQGTDQLISQDWISQARARWDVYTMEHGEVPPDVPGIMGLDCAEMGDDYNVAIARYGGFVTRITERDAWQGVDMIETSSRAADWYKAHNVEIAKVDATGVGAGVAPYMQRAGCVAVGVKGAYRPTLSTEEGEFRKLRDQLYWSLREWLRTDSSAMLPPDEEMIEELIAPKYQIREGKIVVTGQDDLKQILGRSPNRADALRQTFAPELPFFSDIGTEDEPPNGC